MMSDDEEDVHDEYSDDDIDFFEDGALELLVSKTVVVENADGTLRCPFSPNRKKQSYQYKDLLQHADGVAKGKRGAKTAGQHGALSKYLKQHLSAKASPPVQRIHKLDLNAPERKEDMDLLVWPWCGLVYNIDNSQRCEEGQRVGIGNAEIKQFFQAFHPEKATVCWGPTGHMGLAVIFFRRDLEGYKDAQAFEKWFMENGHGRQDWAKANQTKGLGTHLYGWLARKDDYEGRKEIQNDWSISKILKESGDLKDVAMLVLEFNNMQEQRVQNLKDTVTARNEDFQILLHDVEVARRKADNIKLQLEEKHRRELERVKHAAQESTIRHTRIMEEQNLKLQEIRELFHRKCKELEETEQLNQVDKTHLELEKKEEESKNLAHLIQRMTLQLAAKQQAEIERQQVEEIEESQKFAELAESFELSGAATSNAKDLALELNEMRRKLAESEEKSQSLSEDLESGQTTINSLSNKERAANEELEEARKAALEVLVAYPEFGLEDGIYVKNMGQIDNVPWLRECQKRFRKAEDGWEYVFTTKYSIWEEKIKDPEFHCFKNVEVGNDIWERQLDENNKDLLALKKELGKDVLESVVTALKEIEEWNPSGRYPIRAVWNLEENRRATLSEIIGFLSKAAVASTEKKPPAKRRRGGG
ncbi:hypothetical protein R1flu_020061 [Riccia fluitans]|uniref:Factor of DNA methylation 1-5/IDN2 domain-containing protein n=1 Tax=Riccia fluitans TaxID=41844 RepID=A0ABD1ZKP1_9MARC